MTNWSPPSSTIFWQNSLRTAKRDRVGNSSPMTSFSVSNSTSEEEKMKWININLRSQREARHFCDYLPERSEVSSSSPFSCSAIMQAYSCARPNSTRTSSSDTTARISWQHLTTTWHINGRIIPHRHQRSLVKKSPVLAPPIKVGDGLLFTLPLLDCG